MILYRIRDWDAHFENNKTRILKNMTWIPVKNRMDGDGYTLLVGHKNGAAHFGAWIAIAEIASRCHPRGTLVREDGTPHTPESLWRVSRLPARIFAEVLPRLASVELGWLEASEVPDKEAGGTLTPDSAAIRQEDAANRSMNGMNGMEWKEGKEGKGTEVEMPGRAPEDLARVWNENRGPRAAVRGRLSEDRKRAARARLHEVSDLDRWAETTRRLVSGYAADKNWADFDFLIRPGNLERIEEGKYDAGIRLRPVEVTIGKHAPPDPPAGPDEIVLETRDEANLAREMLKQGKPRDVIRAAILERRASA